MEKTPLFGDRHFYKTALAVGLPVMFQQFITALVSLVDNFMVSALGNEMMAAVNVANQVNFVFIILITVVCTAGGIYLAQYKGARDEWGMKQSFRFKVILSMILGISYCLLLSTQPEFLIKIMTHGNTSQAEILVHGADYMRIIGITALFMPISFAIGTSYREIGKATVPLVISIIATAINTFLNWVLIYGNLGAPRLEVEGAAIATIIARAFEAVAFILYARIKKAQFFVGLRQLFRVKIKMFVEIMEKSSLIFLSEITWVASEMFLTALYNSRGGAENVAGMAAGFTFANIFYLLFAGIHTSTAVLVGNRLGAGHLKEAEDRAKWIMSGSVVAGAFISLIMFAAIFIIPVVFQNLSPEAHGIAKFLLFIVALYMPIWALLNAQFAVSRAGGDAVFATMVDVPVTVVAFAPLGLILTFCTSLSAPLIFGLAKLTDFMKVAVAVLMLRKKRWVKKLTVEDYGE